MNRSRSRESKRPRPSSSTRQRQRLSSNLPQYPSDDEGEQVAPRNRPALGNSGLNLPSLSVPFLQRSSGSFQGNLSGPERKVEAPVYHPSLAGRLGQPRASERKRGPVQSQNRGLLVANLTGGESPRPSQDYVTRAEFEQLLRRVEALENLEDLGMQD